MEFSRGPAANRTSIRRQLCGRRYEGAGLGATRRGNVVGVDADATLQHTYLLLFRNPAVYSLGCLKGDKPMASCVVRFRSGAHGYPWNPLKMLKTAKKIFGKIWKSLEIPWKNVSRDSMKTKAWSNPPARFCSILSDVCPKTAKQCLGQEQPDARRSSFSAAASLRSRLRPPQHRLPRRARRSGCRK